MKFISHRFFWIKHDKNSGLLDFYNQRYKKKPFSEIGRAEMPPEKISLVEIARHFGRLVPSIDRPMKGWQRALGGACLMALLGISSIASSQVIIDQWTTGHLFTAGSAGTIYRDCPDANDCPAGTPVGILGGNRHVQLTVVQAGSGVSQTVADEAAGILSHSEPDNGSAISTLIWDATGGHTTGLTLNGNGDVLPLVDGVYEGGINTTGLGANFSAACPLSDVENSFAFAARPDNALGVEVTIDVFSANDQWSRLTKTITTNGVNRNVVIAEFPFSEFVGQGSGTTPAGGGADFGNVGAIRLQISPSGESAVFNIQTALATCGYDFGSAPDQNELNGTALGDFFYPTVNDAFTVGEANTFTQTLPLSAAAHRIVPDSPWIGGAILGSTNTNNTDNEPDGQDCGSSFNGTGNCGDNSDGNVDEDGIVIPSLADLNAGEVLTCDGFAANESQYCAAVKVTNPSSQPAVIAGWIDFERNGFFRFLNCAPDGPVLQNDGSSSTASFTNGGCERSQATLRFGTTGVHKIGDASTACTDGSIMTDGSYANGNFPPDCEGTVVLIWDMSEFANNPGWTVTAGSTWSRFRVTTDDTAYGSRGNQPPRNFFSDAVGRGPVPFAQVESGEVEDKFLGAGTLPVSIHSFKSEFSREGLVIEWGTVSETRNAGFHIWADRGDGMELLSKDMIPSEAVDPLQPQRYRHVIPNLKPGDVKELAITAVDYSGSEEIYGLFEAGASYGNNIQPAPIAWDRIDRDVMARLQTRVSFDNRHAAPGIRGKDSSAALRSSVTEMRADVQVRGAGLHRVTWQDLADAGLELSGVQSSDIAVTLNGKPVPRHIISRSTAGIRSPLQRASKREAGATPESFGPGTEIIFWAAQPAMPDKLYVEDYLYRIGVQPAAAINAKAEGGRGKPGPQTFAARIRHEVDAAYHLASPLEDPWYAARLRADTSTAAYTATFDVPTELAPSSGGRLNVVVGGLTDFDVNPDHNVRVELNGAVLTDIVFEGRTVKSLWMDVPAGVLSPGANQVRVIAGGATAAPADIILVDSVTLEFPSYLRAANDRFLAERVSHTGGLTVDGFTTLDTVAYAWTGNDLVALKTLQFSRGSVRVPTVDVDEAAYWISAVDEVLTPQSIQVSDAEDLFADVSADFLVVAHPAFMPLTPSEPHPLNDFIAMRESEGWNVGLFDITDIQREFGGGMAIPQALTGFLGAADSRLTYDHVLLVGGDSYDYTDNLGLGSISFIPTVYTSTEFINHTPSDGLMSDLDADGVSDKAIGRWPVRSVDDLQAIVTKTLDWSGDAEALSNAVWVTDSQDPSQPSFRGQVERMVDPLRFNGWFDAEIYAIYFDEVQPPAGTSVADAARAQFFDRLEQGRSLSGFVGHGAPAMWTFQGLLTPDDLGDLYNEGIPTLIGTLTCYTTYFVSPYSDTVAHRWMNGYREDAAGNAISGVPNGAVAIHGAGTLSNYGQNEWIARRVLERQLDGLTLGAAVREVRSQAAGRGLSDQVKNWTLLGDPTLRLD